jgi:hypothetical protein
MNAEADDTTPEEGADAASERLVDEEADAAAAEAGAIGGPTPDADLDPAERAGAEAGEGEAEGFELAEKELVEAASHGDPAPDPTTLASDEEAHPEPEHGAADHEHTTERPDEEATH